MHSQFETRAEHLTKHARFFEYTTASDPIGSGIISPVKYVKEFGPELYETGETRIIPLDISEELKTDYIPLPSPSPSRPLHQDSFRRHDTHCPPCDKRTILHCQRRRENRNGRRYDSLAERRFFDFACRFRQPAYRSRRCSHLLHHRFTSPELFGRKAVRNPAFNQLSTPLNSQKQNWLKRPPAPDARYRNRISVLLNNEIFDQTLTITHVLWAMFGIVPFPAPDQAPHSQRVGGSRLSPPPAAPGTYTLVGSKIDPATKEIIDPKRIDWVTGKAFITPPGLWHSHHNESDEAAYIIPIQDAGLQTYLRTLDIQFQHYEK